MLEINEEMLKYIDLYNQALARIAELEEEVLLLMKQLQDVTDAVSS